MRQFNSRFFLVCCILLSCVAFASFTEAYARDEGKLGTSFIRNLLADMFNVMRFPMHTIFKRFTLNPLNFSIGLIVNAMLYSLLLERILYLILRPKNTEDLG